MSSSSGLSNLHSDIVKTYILPKLDGLSLLAVCSSSSGLHSLCSDNEHWKDICQSTWPSVNDPRVSEAISTFPLRHRSFYHDSFPILHSTPLAPADEVTIASSSELISLIEIRYQDKLVYSRVEVTKTNTRSFLSRALWIELSELRPTRLSAFSCSNSYEGEEEFLTELEEKVTMNWIIIDPAKRRAGNFSSVRPIFARRHWMTNEAHLRFVTIFPGKYPSKLLQCRIEVMCGGKEGGELHVREVIMMLHDMESRCLSGKESLVILQRAMEGGRRKLGDRGNEKVEYEEFLKMRRERERIKRMKRIERRKAYQDRIFRLAVFCLLFVFIFEVSFPP